MKQTLLFATGFLLLSFSSFGQTFSTWGLSASGNAYEDYYSYQDTLKFGFASLSSNAYNARLVVYYDGDFGSQDEYVTAILPDLTSIGTAGPNHYMYDCSGEDSTSLVFNANLINSWTASDSIMIVLSDGVNPGNCSNERIRVRLEYNYCTFGMPTFAAFTISDDAICPTESVILSGTPSGGTFSGTGVTGNSFNGSDLQGSYIISYTATDVIGCITSTSDTITVVSSAPAVNRLVCENSTPEVSGGSTYIFSTDNMLNNVLDTASSYAFPAITGNPSIYYYSALDIDHYYILDTIVNDSSLVIDHDNISGDDRGGIALTDTYVYIVGDDATARYTLDLTGPGVSLPIRDGIFTDLRAMKIYSLYNTDDNTMPDNDFSGDFTANAYIELDADLNPTTNIHTLSAPVNLSSNFDQSGIFAGYGELILYSGTSYHAFHIDLDLNEVTDLGEHFPDLYGSENWASWGMAGNNGTDHFIYYRNYDNYQIVSHNLTTDVITPVSGFSDVSDMASFVMHPASGRLYFHYEGGAQFGGNYETLGYVLASDSSSFLFESAGCISEIEFTFNEINLGADTSICENAVLILEPGSGYQSYTWNGLNNNWNVYPVQDEGQYIVVATDEINCSLTDTINVTIDENCGLGMSEKVLSDVKAYPVPNNGNFSLSFDKSLQSVTVQLVNMQGKVCHSSEHTAVNKTLSVNAEGLAPGMYLVQISSEEGMTQLPVIVE